MFDYSCCDFCPLGIDDSGTVCENCDAIKAERRLNRMIADLESDHELEEVSGDGC